MNMYTVNVSVNNNYNIRWDVSRVFIPLLYRYFYSLIAKSKEVRVIDFLFPGVLTKREKKQQEQS